MKIDISLKYIRAFAKISERVKHISERDLYWGQDDNRTEYEISNLDAKELNQFQEFLTDIYNKAADCFPPDEQTRGMMNACLQKVSALKKVKENPLTPIKSLESLADALKEYVRESPEKWVFKNHKDNRNLPYLVTSITFTPADKRNERPPSTAMHMKYVYLDEVKEERLVWYHSDLLGDRNSKKFAGYNVQQLLDRRGYILGIKDFIDVYSDEIKIYLKYRDLVGEQFTSSSVGYSLDRYSVHHWTNLNTDGVSHKLIVNEDPTNRKIELEDTSLVASFWKEDAEMTSLRTPLHMYIRVFNLKDHSGYSVHTSTLTPYVYDRGLINKLILSKEVKELIEILGKGTAEGLGDIISGKAEGIIVGCVGEPGLGKTLSAEVYSEFLERPLYSVQCAQLGVDPTTVEKKLTYVLENAQRWKAVLLLDEADVYIRQRGHDIHQNAIVGVFLRVLEYYRGIIFMTTNLKDSIDDAIESRFSAKIEFYYPISEQARTIWEIQMINHGWKIDDKTSGMIGAMVKKNPNLSGRSIRNLMKLSTLLARYRKSDISLEILEQASKFAVLGKKARRVEEMLDGEHAL